MSSLPLAQQCFDEGFNRRLDALVKSAVNPRVATVAAEMGGPRAAEMLHRGQTLEAILKNPNIGPVERAFRQWTAPYGMLQHLDSHLADHEQAVKLTQVLHDKALAAGDSAGASAAADKLQHLQELFEKRRAELYNQLGTGAEPRRKLVEVGLPMAGAGLAAGGAGVAGANLYTQEKSRRDTLGQMGNATFMDRLKYLMVPKRTMAQRIFNHEA